MSQISIDLEINIGLFLRGKSINLQTKLNYDWTVAVRIYREKVFGSYVLETIEIERENTTGNISVFGELGIEQDGRKIWEKKFSETIKSGYSYARIYNRNFDKLIKCKTKCRLHGLLNISKDSVKYANVGDSEDKIQLKSEEALAKEESKEKIQHKPSQDILKEESKKREQPMGSRFADVTLKCGDVSFPAHKSILSARSPVFSAMFVNPKKENSEKEVDITGIQVSILRVLLIYMYTGEISDLTVSLAADLLFAATKYRLQELVRVCYHFLKNSVHPQIMFRVLFKAYMLDGDLQSLAVDYIFDNLAEFYIFYESEEGKTFRNEKPTMFWDVFESLQERF